MQIGNVNVVVHVLTLIIRFEQWVATTEFVTQVLYFKSGIYCINCNECDAFYYGQTGRNLRIRATEHFKSITKEESTTGFSAHCIENNHTFSKDKINLLHPDTKGFRLNLLEHLEIRRGLKTG